MQSFDKMLFAACAPCQPFSKQRKTKRPDRDSSLLIAFGNIVAEAKPGVVLIENVPGMVNSSAFQEFVGTLHTVGYYTTFDILDAKHFGVPQNRRRLVLLAALSFHPTLPSPRYGTSFRPFNTVRQFISHFPELSAGSADPNIPNHAAASVSELNMKRLKNTPHDGGDRRDWPDSLVLACHNRTYVGHTDVYGRMKWDAPAPTLTGRCNSISNGRYGHPVQDRAISLREAAALQTFPDRYVFYGLSQHIARQIGNAVPVRLAEELGKHIIGLLNFSINIRKGLRQNRHD